MTFDVEKLKLSRPSKKDTQKSNKAETERYKKEQEEKRKAEYEKYKAGLKALEENREDFIENNEKRQNAPVRAMTHNVLANGPQTLVMNNLAKTYQEQQKAENKKAAEDKIFSGYSLDRQKSTIENLQKQLDYAKDYDAKKKKGVTSEKGTLKRDETGRVVTESGVDSDYIADLEKKIKRYSDLYYANKNETQLSQMEKLPEQKSQYEAASQTDADNEVLRRVLDKVNTGNFEWDEDYEYVAEKFGITTDNKSMEQYRDELMAALDKGKQFVSDTATQLDKLDFDYEGLENYKAMLKAQEEYDAQVERAKQNYEERPFLTNLQTIANAPGMAVEAIAKGIKSIGHNDPTDFENYRPMNKYNMPVTTYVQAVRQATDEDIDSEVLSFLYNTGMSVADSTVLALTLGPAATVAMGGASAASYMQEAVDRGLSNKQILAGSIATGAAEAVFEYFSIDKLLNGAMNANTVKEMLKSIGVQAVVEGTEEMFTEVANIISDGIIAGRNSTNAKLIEQYMAEGMTEEEAKKKVILNNIKNIALAGLGGAISGGVSAGGFGAVNVIGEKAMQRRAVTDYAKAIKADTEMMQAYVESGLESEEGTEARKQAEKIQQKLEGDKKVSTKEVKNLIKADEAQVTSEEYGFTPAALKKAEDSYNTYRQTTKSPVSKDVYFGEYQIAYEYGKLGVKQEVLNKSGVLKNLSENARIVAYNQGLKETTLALGQKQMKMSRKEIDNIIKGGKVKLTNVSEETVAKMNVDQMSVIRLADVLTKIAPNMTVEIFESVANKKGEFEVENGSYRRDTRTLSLDLNAGRMTTADYRTTLVRTLSHELTHFIEAEAKDEYKALSEFVIKKLTEGGKYTVEQLVEDKMKADKTLSKEGALAEVVAEGCEMVFENSEAFAELAQTNRTLWEKIKDWFDKTLKQLKSLYKGVEANSYEGRVMKEYIDELTEIWDKGFKKAVENTKATEAVGVQIDTETKSAAPVQMSSRNSTELQKRDADYMAAVESGDMETAQKMVDEYAERMMPDSAIRIKPTAEWHDTIDKDGKLFPVYHGSASEDVYEFREDLIGTANDGGWYGRGFYFAFTKGEAGMYGPNVTKAFLNIKNPFIYQDEFGYYDGKRTEDVSSDFLAFCLNLSEKFPDLAKEQNVRIVENWDSDEGQYDKSLYEIAQEAKNIYGDENLIVQELYDNGQIYYYWQKKPDYKKLGFKAETLKKIREKFITDAWSAKWRLDNNEIIEAEYDEILDALERFGEDSLEYVHTRSKFETVEQAEKHKLSAVMELLEKKYAYIETHLDHVFIERMGNRFRQALINRGHDGVLQSRYGDEVVAFYPEQIKSAEPITYDDNGNVIPLSERFIETNEDIRYSRRTMAAQYEKDLNDWIQGGKRDGWRFVMGYTGDVLQGLGAIESDIYIEGDKIKKILLDHPEMKMGEIKKIPNILNEPAAILVSKKFPSRVIVFGSEIAKNNQPILTILDLRIKDKDFGLLDMQKINSVYTKTATETLSAEENLYTLFETSEIVFLDKKRSSSLLRTIGNLKPYGRVESGSMGSITYDRNKVKIKGKPFEEVFVQKQQRRNPYTDRRILEDAVTSIDRSAFTSQELTVLDRFRGRLNEIGNTEHLIKKYKDMGDNITPAEKNRLKNAEARLIKQNDELFESLGRTGVKVVTNKASELLIQKYGSIEPGEKPFREVSVPARTNKGNKVSQTVRTAMEAEATSDEMVERLTEEVVKGGFSYIPITDAESKKYADDTIKRKGWNDALLDWTAEVNKNQLGKNNVSLGFQLYNNALNAGDTETAVRILTDLAARVREGAQMVQAVRMLKKLSPEYQLYGIQRSIQTLQDSLNERYGDKAPQLEMDSQLVKNYEQAETEEARTAAQEAIYRHVAAQIPHTFMDKWNSWRYLAMLFNPRTHVRNILGNAMFAPVRGAKNATAALIEKLIPQEQRTKAIASGSKLYKAAFEDYKIVADQITGAGKYNDAIGEIERMKPAFGSSKIAKPLNWLADANSFALEAEDMWFSRPAYASALAGYLKARGITDMSTMQQSELDKARAYAIKEAQKATYRDFNDFSNFISAIGRKSKAKNEVVAVAQTVAEGVLPFRRTPANILVRGFEYSPLGLFKVLHQATKGVKEGTATAADVIDSFASVFTGSALGVLGYFLAKAGLVVSSEDKDKKQQEFDELMGGQNYALVVGDKNFTIDWLAPEALVFLMGAETAIAFQERGEEAFIPTLANAFTRISEPMLEMSMLSSLQDVIENVSYSDGKLMGILVNAFTSYLSQGLPTIFGQIERVTETERETTWVDRNKTQIERDIQYLLGKSANKTPGEFQQIPYIDAWGRRESTGTVLARVFNNMLNPAYVSEDVSTPTDNELQRLYDLGFDEVFPSGVSQSDKIDGEYLSADEYVKYAETRGQRQRQLIEDVTSADWYDKLDDTEKSEVIKKAYDYAAETAKRDVKDTHEVPKWAQEVEKTSDKAESIKNYALNLASEEMSSSAISKYYEEIESTGIEFDVYKDYYVRMKEAKGTDADGDGKTDSGSKKKAVMDIINSLNISRDQKDALYLLSYKESTIDEAPWH